MPPEARPDLQDGFTSRRTTTPTMPRQHGDNKEEREAKNKSEPMRSAPLRQQQQRLVKRYKTEVAASMSSVLSTVAAFPLDSVKTRMQTYKYKGFLDCVKHTYRAEKLRGFFRGSRAPPIHSPYRNSLDPPRREAKFLFANAMCLFSSSRCNRADG